MGQNSGGLLPEKATEDTIKGRSVERRRGTKIQVTLVFKAETNRETIKLFTPKINLGLFSRTFCKILLGSVFVLLSKVYTLILGLLVRHA